MAVLNPLGFFWDIENCPVPSNKQTLLIVEKIRQKFNFCGPETEFVCVCDVTKERLDVIEDLNAAQVTVIHVPSISKNAADDKLKTSLRKFSNTHRAPGTVVLITSDINFAPELTDLRYRCGFDIILLHRRQVATALLVTAHQRYVWETDIISCIVDKVENNVKNMSRNACKLIIYDLPSNVDVNRIRERLHQLSCNCGGRVVNVNKSQQTALLRFSNPDLTSRALKRMQNEDVFGSRITVKPFRSSSSDEWPTTTRPISPKHNFCATDFDVGSVFTVDQIKRPSLADSLLNCRNKSPSTFTKFNFNSSIINNKKICSSASNVKIIPNSPPSKLNIVKNSSKSNGTATGTTTMQNYRQNDHHNHRNNYGGGNNNNYNDGGGESRGGRDGNRNGFSLASKNLKRNIMTDKLKRALGFQSKNNPNVVGSSPSSHYFNEVRDACDGPYDTSVDLTPQQVNRIYVGGYRLDHSTSNTAASTATPVDVRVDNLDTSVPIRYLKQNLYFIFSSVVRVLHVTIVPQSEGGWYALIQVSSKGDAQEVVNRLNQTKIGHNHVVLTVSQCSSRSTTPVDELKRRQACSLLNNVASKTLPLDKFLESYDVKFGRGITLAELEQMDDVIKMIESVKGLRVSLITDASMATTYKRSFTSTERRKSRLCFCTKPVMNDGAGVVLTPKLLCCVIRDQIVTMLTKQSNDQQGILIGDIPRRYEEIFGTVMNPKEYGYADIKDLLTDMNGVLERVETEKGTLVKLHGSRHYQVTLEQILYLFLSCPDKELTLKEMQNEFNAEFGFDLPMGSLKNSLTDVLEFFEGRSGIIGVRLTPVQKFALRVRRLLLNFNGDVLLTDLERAYQTQYGETIRPQVFGFPSLIGLMRAASHVLYLKGRGHSLTVCINRNFLGFEINKRRFSSLEFVPTTPSTPTASKTQAVAVDVILDNKPLATSSPPPELIPSDVDSTSKACDNDFIKFTDDGPFTKFLQSQFLLTPSQTTMINNEWWMPKDFLPNNIDDDANVADDAKLTNSNSTSTNNFSSEIYVDNYFSTPPSNAAGDDDDALDEIFRDRTDDIFDAISPIDRASPNLNSSAVTATASSTSTTINRRSRLAAKFLNVN